MVGNEIHAAFCSETEKGKIEMGELYALDFDGIICDSCGESSVSAVKAGSSLHSTQNNFCFLFKNLYNFQHFYFQLLFPLWIHDNATTTDHYLFSVWIFSGCQSEMAWFVWRGGFGHRRLDYWPDAHSIISSFHLVSVVMDFMQLFSGLAMLVCNFIGWKE